MDMGELSPVMKGYRCLLHTEDDVVIWSIFIVLEIFLWHNRKTMKFIFRTKHNSELNSIGSNLNDHKSVKAYTSRSRL